MVILVCAEKETEPQEGFIDLRSLTVEQKQGRGGGNPSFSSPHGDLLCCAKGLLRCC